MTKRICAVQALLLLFVLLIGGRAYSQAGPDCPSCVADFALYDPPYEEDGVWEEEVTALKAMLTSYHFTYQVLNAYDINIGALRAGGVRRYRALIAPGGYAYYRKIATTAAGDNSLRQFLNAGGNYLGFCAGAYWGSKTVRWSETGNGYVDYPYDLKLYQGVAQGPLEWMPWKNGSNANLEIAAINTANSTMAAIGLPANTRFFYAGGPWFVNPATPPPGYQVWARAVMPVGTPASLSDGNGQPTIIRFNVGKGTVILFSYHPEILINSMIDKVQLSQYYKEKQIQWKRGNQTWAQINLNSWNIVHAALQITANKPVTRLTSLP